MKNQSTENENHWNQVFMKPTRTISFLVLISLFVLAVVTPDSVHADGETSDLLRTYAVNGSPLNIAVKDSDSAWFTLPDEDAIGSLSFQNDGSHNIQKFTLPNTDSEPYDLVIDGNAIWFTQRSGNRIGKFDIASATFDEYEIPTASSGPTGIDVAPNGLVWFLESDTQTLAVFNPSDDSFTEYPLPDAIADSELAKLRAVSSNLLWFTMPDANSLINYDVSRNRFTPTSTLSPTGSATRPIGLTLDGANTPWTTASDTNLIGRYTPGTLTFFRWFNVPTKDSGVANLAFDDLGSTWAIFFTEADSGKVGRLVVRATSTRFVSVVEYRISAANSSPWGIDVDDEHKAWIADPGAKLIAVWRAPYTDQAYLPYMSK